MKAYRFITPDIQLLPEYTTTELSSVLQNDIISEIRNRLGEMKPLLKHIMEVKIVCNERRNFVNLRISSPYVPLIHIEDLEGSCLYFAISDKIEPYVIIAALDLDRGVRLTQLTSSQLQLLPSRIETFKKKFGISNETYHYTTLQERQNTVSFGARRENRAHSSSWHLKMRVATAMYREEMPISKILDFEFLKKQIEPVRYNFNRENIKWEDVYELMKRDALTSSPSIGFNLSVTPNVSCDNDRSTTLNRKRTIDHNENKNSLIKKSNNSILKDDNSFHKVNKNANANDDYNNSSNNK